LIGERAVHDFDGDVAMHCGLDRAVDDPVGSLPDSLDELVTAQTPAFGNKGRVLLEDLFVQAAELC
jgi:hypothetical protein